MCVPNLPVLYTISIIWDTHGYPWEQSRCASILWILVKTHVNENMYSVYLGEWEITNVGHTLGILLDEHPALSKS